MVLNYSSQLGQFEVCRRWRKWEAYAGGTTVWHADYKGEEQEPPCLDVLHGLDKLALIPLFGLSSALELLWPQRCEFSFCGVKETRRRRVVGEEEP